MMNMFYEIGHQCPISKNFFQHNLLRRYIALSYNFGYAARSVNYTKKSFMKLATSERFHKTFFSIIYAINDIFP